MVRLVLMMETAALTSLGTTSPRYRRAQATGYICKEKNDPQNSTLTVLALAGVALDHLVAGLEARESHIGNGVLLVVGLLSGDDGRASGKREVNTREARAD